MSRGRLADGSWGILTRAANNAPRSARRGLACCSVSSPSNRPLWRYSHIPSLFPRSANGPTVSPDIATGVDLRMCESPMVTHTYSLCLPAGLTDEVHGSTCCIVLLHKNDIYVFGGTAVPLQALGRRWRAAHGNRPAEVDVRCREVRAHIDVLAEQVLDVRRRRRRRPAGVWRREGCSVGVGGRKRWRGEVDDSRGRLGRCPVHVWGDVR